MGCIDEDKGKKGIKRLSSKYKLHTCLSAQYYINNKVRE